jgi:hypothetical protein
MKIRIIMIISIFILSPLYAYSMKVSFFLGDVKMERGGKTASLKMGDNVGNGDIIRTGKGAMLELSYPNNSKITVKANTVVKIGSSNIKGSDDVSIISGQVKGKFEKLQKGEYKFYTPTTVCSVRGTEFDVAVSRGGDSMTSLSEGAVDVENFYGSVKLKPGNSVEADVAGKPSAKKGNLKPDSWESGRNNDLEKKPGDQAQKYNRYMDRFEKESGKTGSSIDEIGKEVEGIESEDDLKKSGEKVEKAERESAAYLMLSEASGMNVRSLMEDFEENDIYEKFQEAADKSNKVKEQQLANYQAIQKVKADYLEAYGKIIGKYKDDKDKIFKGLDDFKKDMFKKDGQE